jgi:hypothetical protein
MRILIRYQSTIRKFVVLNTSDRDGSLVLTIRRSGFSTSETSWRSSPEDQGPKTTEFDKPRRKDQKITIHQSGRVNYHDSSTTIYIAPLTQTKQPFAIFGYRVPALAELDVHDEDIAEEDTVVDFTDLPDGPISFTAILGPADFAPQGRGVRLGYEAGYSLALQVDLVTFEVPPALTQHFTTLTPERGLFSEQQMAEDQAMISYHQALSGRTDAILYAPDAAGVFRLIFSVPMRIAPQFEIEFFDPELHVSDLDVQRDGRAEKVMLKFKVRKRKSGEIIRTKVAFKRIELHAEL